MLNDTSFSPSLLRYILFIFLVWFVVWGLLGFCLFYCCFDCIARHVGSLVTRPGIESNTQTEVQRLNPWTTSVVLGVFFFLIFYLPPGFKAESSAVDFFPLYFFPQLLHSYLQHRFLKFQLINPQIFISNLVISATWLSDHPPSLVTNQT